MGMNAYLRIPGVKGSARKREANGKTGLSGDIVVHGVSGQVLASLDWTTGLPKKGNGHKPIVVTKPIDNASPALHTALHKGKGWDTATIEFWRMPPGGGAEENYFAIVLGTVQVLGIKTLMANNRRQENTLIPEQEEVTFVYRFIHYRFKSGGKVGGTEGETKSEFANTIQEVALELPLVAKTKDIAKDLGKDAGKFFVGEVLALLKGEEEKKK